MCLWFLLSSLAGIFLSADTQQMGIKDHYKLEGKTTQTELILSLRYFGE